MPNLLPFGSISRVSGNSGELEVIINTNTPIPNPGEPLFFEIENSKVPFFISEINGSGTKCRIKFDDIDSTNDAQQYCNVNLFVTSAQIKKTSAQEVSKQITGYIVLDKTNGETGIVKDIQQYPAQQIIVIDYHKKEILLPVTPEFIIKTDHTNKILHVNFPEGLLEIYT